MEYLNRYVNLIRDRVVAEGELQPEGGYIYGDRRHDILFNVSVSSHFDRATDDRCLVEFTQYEDEAVEFCELYSVRYVMTNREVESVVFDSEDLTNSFFAGAFAELIWRRLVKESDS